MLLFITSCAESKLQLDSKFRYGKHHKMIPTIKLLSCFLLAIALTCNLMPTLANFGPKHNGDIFVVSDDTTSAEDNSNIDFDEVMATCNASFSIPMDYVVEFNNTGVLPNDVDKTGPCYIRCFYEKTGFLSNWILNETKIRQYMWPATGDSIPVCQEEGKNETNACVRAYAIAKCLMIRALVDARNNPTK